MTEYTAGFESRVNTTNSIVHGSSIAALRDGGYVVTWSALYRDDYDGSSGVYAQRFDGAGNKIGVEFQVNSYSFGDQDAYGVTALVDGGFVIVWVSDEQDGSGRGIYSQRFTNSGARVGGEQRVNTYTAGDQLNPDIAALSSGGHVVTWTSLAQDGGTWDIYAQRYDASGSTVGGEQRINSNPDGIQLGARVIGLSDGGYLIAWTARDFSPNSEIVAQRFDASGQRVGGEFQIKAVVDNDLGLADVSLLEDGSFVATWTSDMGDASGYDVYAQRFNAAGTALDDEVLVNTTVAGTQAASRITALADGGYAIIWEDNGPAVHRIKAQVFDASGARVGSEVQLSSTSTEVAWHGGSDVAALPNGFFVVGYRLLYGPNAGIFARQFTPVSSIVGDSGNNSLTGTAEADSLMDQAGDDLIAGLSGNDTLSGGAGSDRLFGGTGDDHLSADQSISFDNGATVDELYGGAGDDLLFSGFGDIVDGGDGFDTVGLSYVGASAGITGDTAILHQGEPLVPGGGTFQSIERFSDIALTEFDDKMVIGDQDEPATVRSWNGDDHLIGQEVSITMYGGNGNDLLVGSTSADVIYGESGDDRLIGFTGADVLVGGAGADRFIFVDLGDTDWIYDFEPGLDKIDLSDLDANSLVFGDQAFTFIGTAEFSGTAGELRGFAGSDTYFYGGDVDGDHTADFIFEIRLAMPNEAVIVSDFVF